MLRGYRTGHAEILRCEDRLPAKTTENRHAAANRGA
jgi:hypothetical protein